MVNTTHSSESERRPDKHKPRHKDNKGGHSPDKDGLYTDKELNQVRWQISWLNNWCGGYKSHNRGVCRRPRNWKGNLNNGRCKFHSGLNAHGPVTREGKRNQMLSRITSGIKTNMTKDIFNQEELDVYFEVFEYLKDNYDIDDVGADQLSILFVYQKKYLIPKLQQGYNVDLTVVSEQIRKWCNEMKITPKSREGFNFEGSGNLTWGVIVERLHNEEQEKKKEDVKIED